VCIIKYYYCVWKCVNGIILCVCVCGIIIIGIVCIIIIGNVCVCESNEKPMILLIWNDISSIINVCIINILIQWY